MLFNQALRRVFSSQARAEALHIFATGCPHGPALPRGRLSALSTCRFGSLAGRTKRLDVNTLLFGIRDALSWSSAQLG